MAHLRHTLRLSLVGLVVSLALLTSCGRGEQVPRLPNHDAFFAALSSDDHIEAFGLMEEGIEGMEAVRMTYTVESSGAFTAFLTGVLDLRTDADTLLTAQGSFGGEVMDLVLAIRGDSLIARSGDRQKSVERPEDVREALVIGLTRMGIFHNLARLSAAQPPDHGEGGVREWVEVVDVRAPSGNMEGEESGSSSFRFGIRVSGQDSGEAVLIVNRETGLPRMRIQEVRFPGGMMTVRAEYAWRR
ncbi:MAG: hypothetical protein R6W82_06100 [bacterium]